MNQEYAQQRQRETEEQLHAASQQEALRQQTERQRQQLENGWFLKELTDVDLDSELADWIQEEYPTWFSSIRAMSERPDNWGEMADLKMGNRRERAVAERTPGRLLRDRPYLLAIAQGENSLQELRGAMTSDQRRLTRGAADVAADLMALSTDGEGLKAVSTATTETHVKREDAEDKSAKKRIAGVFR